MTKVLITGSRHWYPKHIMWPYLDKLFEEDSAIFLIVGDADGVDKCAIDWAKSRKCPYRKYKAYWEKLGKRAGPDRNKKMFTSNPDITLCLAFPLPSSTGTIDCIDRARSRGIEVRRFEIV